MMKRFAHILLPMALGALASRDARALTCRGVENDPILLTSPGWSLPADGALLLGLEGRVRLGAYYLEHDGKRFALRSTELAPGLYALRARVPLPPGTYRMHATKRTPRTVRLRPVQDPSAGTSWQYRNRHLPIDIRVGDEQTAVVPAPNVASAEYLRRPGPWGGVRRVTAHLAKPAPTQVVALIGLWPRKPGGRLRPQAWTLFPGAKRAVWMVYAAGMCAVPRIESVEPKAGYRASFRFVDGFGRLSPPSKTTHLRNPPNRAARPKQSVHVSGAK